MEIAIIGTGNVGGTLARKWAVKGHSVNLGVRDRSNFKGIDLLNNTNIHAYSIAEAVGKSEVVLIATPAPAALAVTEQLGDTKGKIIIDSMNIVMGKGPEGYDNTSDAILANTQTVDVVKCFNTTGYNNIEDPVYENRPIDMFMAGDSEWGKKTVSQLSTDAGFETCYDIGGNERFQLMEQFAFFWINLAVVQGHGRNIAFKLLKR